ncbi:LOW QUALITY PROTEIN: Hypothetical protein PHPALM_36610 [Phytophthora palmivora]|uniref:HAT C-terminal dimerisation domain-containing protein n=1 Tax=Phytophthora palmivora TaxID=4796 RepID=A0A2P4WZH6_9STRA|nr:LOW QUALITY PROTEIN: Hypothetical protein PHPALM_36610 [Phytophthora palmivora]
MEAGRAAFILLLSCSRANKLPTSISSKSRTLETSPSPAIFDAVARVCTSTHRGRGTATSFRTFEATTTPDFEEVMLSAAPAEILTLFEPVRLASVDGDVQHTPHFCENPETRRYTDLEPIGKEYLLDGLVCAVRHVKMTMRSNLPVFFGMKLDGWSHNLEHYMVVFACYEKGGQPRCQPLAMAPLLQAPGQDLTAEGHVGFVREMLFQEYGKHFENCLYLVGDNCATNRRVTILMGVPLVGCASHCLNLAVQNVLGGFNDELAQVKDLMIKSLSQSAKLRLKTKLWSPSDALELHIQHHRYMKLLEFAKNNDDLAEYPPSSVANRTLRKLLEDLKKIESEAVSIADVRCYFDALISLWPGFATYLGPHAAIVHNPNFGYGCVKVQQGDTAELTRSEKTALSRFAVHQDAAQPVPPKDDTTGSFVEQKRKTSVPTTTYMLVHSILPTSNKVERFFSVAKATLRLQRQRLQPAALETVLLLRMNDELWDANVVNECC